MKSKFIILSVILVICMFCFGCGDSSDNSSAPDSASVKSPAHLVSPLDDEYEKVIKYCLNQQLYYENKEADDFAKDIIFSTDVVILPTHPAYFSGGACYISSKKELFSNIRYRLLPLTLFG